MSTQPVRAVRSPSWISSQSGPKNRWSWQTLQTSGRPGSVRRIRFVSVTIDMTCLRMSAGSASTSIVLPSDLLIFLTPSVPRTVGRLGEHGLRLREGVAVAAVEGPDDLPRELQVRRLVLADRYPRCLVDDDVRGLQDRVGEQGVVDVVGLLELLLLVGRRAFEPAHRASPSRGATRARCARGDGSARTACSGPDPARGRATRRPSRACAPEARPGRACSSARGSRRCSRSPRTRPAARRSCGSHRGRCRGGRSRTAGCPRRSAAAPPVPRAAQGQGRARSSWRRECSGRPITLRSPAWRAERVGYHSRDVRHPFRRSGSGGSRDEPCPAARRRARRRDRRSRGCPRAPRTTRQPLRRGRRAAGPDRRRGPRPCPCARVRDPGRSPDRRPRAPRGGPGDGRRSWS